MKKIYFFIVTLLLASLSLSAQTWQWTKPEPNGNLGYTVESDNVHDVETDATGNVYVLGDYLDSLFLNNIYRTTGNGSYLAKYDSTGALLWYKLIVPVSTTSYNFNFSIRATDLTVNANGVFITGKYGPSRYLQFSCSTNTGTGETHTYDIGGYALVSGFDDIGFFLTKFDANGNVAWNKGGTMSFCNFGSYVPAGVINYNPNVISDNDNNIISGFEIGTNYSSFFLGGDVISLAGSNAGSPSYLVAAKYNGAGVLQWANSAGGGFSDVNISGTKGYVESCNSMAADNNGNIFFYGTALDSSRFGPFFFRTVSNNQGGAVFGRATFIAKLSASGTWQFVKELCNNSQNILGGGIGNPELLAVDNANNLYALVNGNSVGYAPFVILGDSISYNANARLLVKLDNNGNLIRYQSIANSSSALSSIDYANNNLYLAGRLDNNINYNIPPVFSSLTVLKSGSADYFIAKADTAGIFKWVTSFSSTIGATYGNVVKYFNGNIYSGGNYGGGLNSLGNLNGSFNNLQPYTANLFLGKLKDQYIRIGAISAKQVMPGCSISIPFTSTGLTFSASNKFSAELSNASGDFTTPTVIGTVKSTGAGSIKATIPTTLAVSSSGYKIRIRSTDTLLTGFNYFAYADTGYTLSIGCPGTASSLSSSAITGSSATLNWAAVGCVAGYKIQYRAKGTTAWTTVNTAAAATSLNITGLLANTIYQWRIATKCKTGTTTSFSAYSSIQQFKTAAAFASVVSTEELQLQTNGFTVYPNPAKQTATVQFNATKAGAGTIELADLTGRVLYKSNIASINGINKQNINLSNLAAGMYIITLTQPGQTKQTLKINKE